MWEYVQKNLHFGVLSELLGIRERIASLGPNH